MNNITTNNGSYLTCAMLMKTTTIFCHKSGKCEVLIYYSLGKGFTNFYIFSGNALPELSEIIIQSIFREHVSKPNEIKNNLFL